MTTYHLCELGRMGLFDPVLESDLHRRIETDVGSRGDQGFSGTMRWRGSMVHESDVGVGGACHHVACRVT